MHTGNASVISTSVMNPLWIGLSVIYDGLPCFNDTTFNVRNPCIGIVNFGQWPFDDKIQHPKTASKSRLLHSYGPDVFNVSVLKPLSMAWMVCPSTCPVSEWSDRTAHQ